MSSESANQNSSITRVRPILRQLLGRNAERDQDRLRALLRLCPQNQEFAATLAESTGPIESWGRCRRTFQDRILGTIELESAFEWSVPPPGAFLRWLILNPSRLQWPEERGIKRRFGDGTQALREALIHQHDPESQQRALLELDRLGGQGSEGLWWAFEGFTQVDCLIETDTMVLSIEGKRNEGISAATDWFPQRNQISRNLECARQVAAKGGKQYAVLVIAEMVDPYLEKAVSPEALKAGWPHLTDDEHEQLLARFLGVLRWGDLREALDLGTQPFPNDNNTARDWRP